MMVSNRNLLFQVSIFGCHVSFRGCIPQIVKWLWNACWFLSHGIPIRKTSPKNKSKTNIPRDPGSPSMVLEIKYYWFRRWLDTLIIIWEYDWIPRDGRKWKITKQTNPRQISKYIIKKQTFLGNHFIYCPKGKKVRFWISGICIYIYTHTFKIMNRMVERINLQSRKTTHPIQAHMMCLPLLSIKFPQQQTNCAPVYLQAAAFTIVLASSWISCWSVSWSILIQP